MKQIIRYGLVGVLSNLTMYFIYLFITYLGLEPKKAMTLVYIAGASLSFFGHRKWSFTHQGNVTQAAIRYTAAHLSGYLLNFLILFIFVDRLGYAHQLIQAFAIIAVAGFLFVVFKYFVFAKKQTA